ncbi:hypothetical protein K7432_006659 [Basidiobolus ranarum]|uniref:Uncharacterized protein n=1 Tax=Basidiobolus ranarum TaxID=34480 RepID=A0ABR2WUK0_9FUNG
MNHSPIYKSFLKDGMYFFLLITVSNIITPCLVVKAVLGENSSILFDVDWAIQCTLITLQLSYSFQIRQGKSNFSQSASIHHSTQLEYDFKGVTSIPNNITAPEYDKTEPWEGYGEISMEILTQPNKVEPITSKRRDTSEEPLTILEGSNIYS